MGRVLLCLGRYARNPYFVERAYVNVYSVEELCYCLIRNAYLISMYTPAGISSLDSASTVFWVGVMISISLL